MDIKLHSIQNFKGYDARHLKGFLMTSNCYGIAEEMYAIGKKEGFKIFSATGSTFNQKCSETIPPYKTTTAGLWAQDYWTIVKNKILALEIDTKTKCIKDFFNLQLDFTQQVARSNPEFINLNQSLWNMFSRISEPETTHNNLAKTRSELINEFQQKKLQLKDMQKTIHIAGGNMFIVKNKNKEDELLIGEDELKNYSIEEIKSMYCVENITVLPQMDYHLDMFIRPLDNGKILLTDDNLTLNVLNEGFQKLIKYISRLPAQEQKDYKEIFVKLGSKIQNFKRIMDLNKNPSTSEIAEILEKKGYEIIRVPGRIYSIYQNKENEIFLKHHCNYINANVFKNKENQLVYITNKSNIDNDFGITPEIAKKINFSFEKNFVDTISKYIDKEHFYFIKGEDNFVAEKMLYEYTGGIHCTCVEIPKDCNLE